jgi:hypothetical protein
MAKQIWMPEEGDRVRRENGKFETIEQVGDYADDSWSVYLVPEIGNDAEEIEVSEYDEINHYWKEDV